MGAKGVTPQRRQRRLAAVAELGLFGISGMKDYLTKFVMWIAGACSLLLLLYFLTSPLIFLSTNRGPAASPLLLKLSGPMVDVLESDFKGPTLWYFGLWGIEIDYFASEPVPKPPWYVTPAYILLGPTLLLPFGYPLLKRRLKNLCVSRRTNGLSNDGERGQTHFASPTLAP